MARMVDAALAKAMAFAARWLSDAVLGGFMFGRSAALSAWRRAWFVTPEDKWKKTSVAKRKG
jgi:hypothetical protein